MLAATPDPAGNPPSHLYVFAADGSGERRLTSGAFEDRDPSWSPDGRWIAFQRAAPGPPEIDLIHPDGSGLRPLFLRTTVSFRAMLSGAARIVSLRPAARACAKQYLGSARATSALGMLAPGSFVELRLRLKPLRPGKLTIALTETSQSPELDRSDDAVSLRTRVTR